MKPNHKCNPAKMALLYIRQQFICTTFKFDAYEICSLNDLFILGRLQEVGSIKVNNQKSQENMALDDVF